MATRKATSAIRMEGLTLAVKDVKRSVSFYGKKLGLKIEIDSAPNFALVRVGPGASIGLLAARHAVPKGTRPATKAQHAAIHVELSTDVTQTFGGAGRVSLVTPCQICEGLA